MASICAVADIHCQEDIRTTEADILVVAGDLTYRGTIADLAKTRAWLKKQPQTHKIIIAGNHDFCFDNKQRIEAETMMGGDGIVYLRDQSITIEGLKIYGTPWQPWFHNWAFNLSRGPEIAAKWADIPPGIDLLITHGPPFGYGDRTSSGERVGCDDLLKAIDLKRPRAVTFGHIHEDYGQWDFKGTKLYNCTVGPHWESNSHGPVLFEL